MSNGTLHAPRNQAAKQFASQPTTSAGLTNEQAVSRMLDALTGMPDPDEVLSKAGLSRCELRKLEGDDEITAASDTRREAVISTPWHLEAGDGKEATGPDVDFILEQITPHMEAMARTAWNAVPYGYSVWETVYKPGAERRYLYEIDRISEKPFEWFKPQTSGALKFFDLTHPMGVEVDQRKFFLTVREPTYRNPYGRALYSRLYWPWFFRTTGWKFWIKHLERWGIPFLLGHTSGNAEAMAKALAKMVQNATAAVGMDDKVDILQSQGQAHFEMFERAVCARVQKVILGQTLTTDAGGSTGKSGSYALGQVHNEVRQDRRNADLRLITKTIQRQIEVLWTLNELAGEPPVAKFEDDTGLQLDRAERDSKLLSSGKVKFSEQYFLRTYDFEPGEVEIVETPAVDPSATPTKKEALKAAREERRFTREQQAVEELIDNSALQLDSPVDPEAIKAAIKAARDPDDLADRLAVLFAGADHESFATVLERCLFAADVMGYAHAGPSSAPVKEVRAEQPAPEPQELHFHINDGARVLKKNPDGSWRSDPAAD